MAVSSRTARPVPSVAALSAAHLFGIAPGTTGESARAAELRQVVYALTGVLASDNPHNGSAILGAQGQPMRLYHIGDSLGGGGRLSEVLVDQVRVDFGDRIETVKLLNHLGGSGISLQLSSGTSDDGIPKPGQGMAVAQPIDVSAGESLFSGIVAVPYSGAADPNGGMLLHPSRAYQRRFGLHNGDVLTAVNGTSVNNVDTLTAALKASGQTLTLSLVRNGVPQTVGISSQN